MSVRKFRNFITRKRTVDETGQESCYSESMTIVDLNLIMFILIYLMKFCRETQIDIIDITLKKLEKLQKKYPVGYNETNDDKPNHEAYIKIKKAYRENK